MLSVVMLLCGATGLAVRSRSDLGANLNVTLGPGDKTPHQPHGLITNECGYIAASGFAEGNASTPLPGIVRGARLGLRFLLVLGASVLMLSAAVFTIQDRNRDATSTCVTLFPARNRASKCSLQTSAEPAFSIHPD